MNFYPRKILFSILSILSILGYGFFVFAAPPGTGGYNPGETLDPECNPGDLVPEPCIVKSSNWSLTGNTGTDGGTTNFVGTTDAQDLVLKTNSNEIARFGQNGNVVIGSANIGFGLAAPIASGINSLATGMQTIASGIGSVTFGYQTTASGVLSVAFGSENISSGDNAASFGNNNIASGQLSFVAGTNNIASGYGSIALGRDLLSQNWYQFVIGDSNTSDLSGSQIFSIGNGSSLLGRHNAYTLWRDGSFAYNDDNFQNDDSGTEQNMFYFNYGNHDGLGAAQTKQAIRLGSALNDEWDINSANIGNKSVAIGFSDTFANSPTASGLHSFALGTGTIASGSFSTAFGFGTTASESSTTAFGSGTVASGRASTVFGVTNYARSYSETALGRNGTDYTPISTTAFSTTDRLFNIGNGDGTPLLGFQDISDAFTILKAGQVGIAIDNFEAVSNGEIFQIGDGLSGIIAYVDSATGNWVAVSDERKKENITDLSYGLNEILQLRPTSFDYKRNNEHTIGFIAQQVLSIVPEAVYGTESEGYGMSYAILTPVIVKAIQDMNLNITQLSDMTRENTWRDSLIEWFGTATNGITKLFAGEVHTDTLCVGQTCVTESQLQQLLQGQNITSATPTPIVPAEDAINTDPIMDTGDSHQENPPETPVVNTETSTENPLPITDTVTE